MTFKFGIWSEFLIVCPGCKVEMCFLEMLQCMTTRNLKILLMQHITVYTSCRMNKIKNTNKNSKTKE